MPNSPIKSQRLVAVFLFGMLLLNYPLLPLFNGRGMFVGIPALYAYIFIAWGILIVLMAAVVERTRPP